MIENLNLKLSGELPVTRSELFSLVDSWGRRDSMNHSYINLKPKECYPLENLNVSEISDFSEIFRCSLYNGNINNWNVSNAIIMESMFSHSDFNSNISKWNISNVKTIDFMFYRSKFNNDCLNDWNIKNVKFMNSTFERSMFDGDISKWKFNINVNCIDLFWFNKNFENKYNNNKMIPRETKEFLHWFENNKKEMKKINQIKREEILDFFSFDNKTLEKDLL